MHRQPDIREDNRTGTAAWAAMALVMPVLAGCVVCDMATLTLPGHGHGQSPGYGPAWAIGTIEPGQPRSSLRFNDMHVDLADAPPFVIVFPDGYKANSRDVDPALIAAHLGAPAANEKGLTWASYRLADEKAGSHFVMTATWVAGRDQVGMHFLARSDTSQVVFETADGSRAFRFPLAKADFAALFGVDPDVNWQPVLGAADCGD